MVSDYKMQSIEKTNMSFEEALLFVRKAKVELKMLLNILIVADSNDTYRVYITYVVELDQ